MHTERKRKKKNLFHIMFLRNWKIFGKKKTGCLDRVVFFLSPIIFMTFIYLFVFLLNVTVLKETVQRRSILIVCFFYGSPWTLNFCCCLVALYIRVGTIFFYFHRFINIFFHKFLSLECILFLFSFLASCMKILIWQGYLRTRPIH